MAHPTLDAPFEVVALLHGSPGFLPFEVAEAVVLVGRSPTEVECCLCSKPAAY